MLTVIQRGRRGGKTYELVARLKRDAKTILVVSVVAERERLIQHYELAPEVAKRIRVAAPDCLRGLSGDVLVDNADWILSRMLGRPVDTITVGR